MSYNVVGNLQVITMDPPFLNNAEVALSLASVVTIHERQMYRVWKVVTELFLFKDRTEERPLVIIAKVVEGPIGPFFAIKRVVLNRNFTVRFAG